MQERVKEITIGECRYQIGSMNPFDGSWILMQVLPRVTEAVANLGNLPVSSDADDATRVGMIVYSLLGGLADTKPEALKRMQQIALSCCRRIESNNMPIPIFEGNRWLVKELESDMPTVMMLSVHAIVHNLTPFFQGPGLAGVMQSVTPDQN